MNPITHKQASQAASLLGHWILQQGATESSFRLIRRVIALVDRTNREDNIPCTTTDR